MRCLRIHNVCDIRVILAFPGRSQPDSIHMKLKSFLGFETRRPYFVHVSKSVDHNDTVNVSKSVDHNNTVNKKCSICLFRRNFKIEFNSPFFDLLLAHTHGE